MTHWPPFRHGFGVQGVADIFILITLDALTHFPV